ncbi:PQQ-dependent sugar dehydrogenase [Hyphococcus sp.]|uniref:PQQ-dependent sugar dehydrogenase n=1 Tax=Hyphococcus sp. TaxID=2038636 RepID=UPI0035C6AC56
MAMTPRFLMMTCCAASMTLLAAACSGGGEASSPKGGGDASLQETLADPAPEGETALDVEVLADGLDVPWCITFLPNGDILFTERAGRMRIIRDGELVEEPVAGVPEVLVYNQGGLFDILLHPDFEENGVLYISYAHGTEKENATRLARAVFDGSSLSDLEVLYDAKPLKDTGHHYGARLAWGGARCDGPLCDLPGGVYLQAVYEIDDTTGRAVLEHPRGVLLSNLRDGDPKRASAVIDVRAALKRLHAEGVTHGNDWDAFGQRLSESGTITFADVKVEPAEVLGDPAAPPPPRTSLVVQSFLTPHF